MSAWADIRRTWRRTSGGGHRWMRMSARADIADRAGGHRARPWADIPERTSPTHGRLPRSGRRAITVAELPICTVAGRHPRPMSAHRRRCPPSVSGGRPGVSACRCPPIGVDVRVGGHGRCPPTATRPCPSTRSDGHDVAVTAMSGHATHAMSAPARPRGACPGWERRSRPPCGAHRCQRLTSPLAGRCTRTPGVRRRCPARSRRSGLHGWAGLGGPPVPFEVSSGCLLGRCWVAHAARLLCWVPNRRPCVGRNQTTSRLGSAGSAAAMARRGSRPVPAARV